MGTLYDNKAEITGYTQAFYTAYSTVRQHVLQEQTDVYAGAVKTDTFEGELKRYEFMGTLDLTERRGLHEDVPLQETEHISRYVSIRTFHKAVLVDDLSKVAFLVDPSNDYMQALAKGAIRKKNAIIYNAFTADVLGGKDMSTTYKLKLDTFSPADNGGRVIPHDSTAGYAKGGTSRGLTIDKLILAREALCAMKNDANQTFYIACSYRQLSDLYNEAVKKEHRLQEVADLKSGMIQTFMGFRFLIDYNIQPVVNGDLDGDTTIYPCYAFAPDALLFVESARPSFRIDWNVEKACWQVYAGVGYGAIRLDEKKIVKIECA